MVLLRLDDRRRSCGAFGVAGTIQHVGLLSHDQQLCESDQPHVHHIRPPREFGGTMTAHYIGHLDDMTRAEVQQLQDWVVLHRDAADRMELSAPVDYVLIPHCFDVRDTQTGRYMRTKFSCSGFVQEAYRAIDVTLVDTDNLPVVTIFELSGIWGDRWARVAQARYLSPEQSEWNILLPAHILQSLAREHPRWPPHIPTHNRVLE